MSGRAHLRRETLRHCPQDNAPELLLLLAANARVLQHASQLATAGPSPALAELLDAPVPRAQIGRSAAIAQ